MSGMKGITSMSGWGRIADGTYQQFAATAAANNQNMQDAFKKRFSKQKAKNFSGISGADGKISSLDTDADTFMRRYTAEMNIVKVAAKRVLADGGAGLEVRSSDPAVAQAAARWQTAAHTNYVLTVRRTAQTQRNVSHSWQGNAETTLVAGGSLRILTSFGGVSVDLSDYAGAKTNADVLRQAVEKINAADIAVTAAVLEHNTQVSLQIKANEMGAAAEFLVSGTFAESAGLNVPAAAAQDAVYQLNGKTVVTDSNEVNLDDYRITVQLKAAGTALVQVGTDSSKAADHLEKMTAAYNHALHFLQSYSEMGTGVRMQAQNMRRILVPEQSLQRVGITVAEDGTLHADRNAFLQQYAACPELTESVISGSRGLAAAVQKRAAQGLEMPSRSLVDWAENLLQFEQPYGIYAAPKQAQRYSLTEDFSSFVNVQI